MTTVIYLTKNKFWIEGNEYLIGQDLEKAFAEVVENLKLRSVRIVLGDDLSYVVGFKIELAKKERAEILRIAQSLMPIDLTTDNFDWKEKELKNGEIWVQAVAMERMYLESLSRTTQRLGLKVDLVIPIGVLLARVQDDEDIRIITYAGQENLTIVDIGGVTESVFGRGDLEQARKYVKNKWGLKSEIKEISISAENFSLEEAVAKEKTKGQDSEVLSIKLLENIEAEPIPLVGPTIGKILPNTENEQEKVSWGWVWVLVGILLSIGIGVAVWWMWNGNPRDIGSVQSETVTVPTIEATPTETKIDLSKYKIQVLNGSGIAGLAGQIRDSLVTAGFQDVDVGNAPETLMTTIRVRGDVPDEVTLATLAQIKDYEIGEKTTLTTDSKYDLVIVVGSIKK